MRTLAEWLTLQEAVHPKSIDLELTRVAAVARALGIEAPEFPVITVAGTNGKGSVVAHLEALFGALGAATGMFTSPHLLKYNERIRLEGREAADSELIAAFARIEAARGATTPTFFEYNPPAALAGSVQYRNAATALAAVEALARDAGSRAAVRRLAARLAPLEEGAVSRALRAVRLPGRFQVVPGEVEWILDIAHNPPAAEVLSRQLRERAMPGAERGERPRARTFAVIGVLADKDAGGIAAALAGLIDHWIVCTLPGARGSSAGQLAERLGRPRSEIQLADSVTAGCELARAAARPGDRVVVFGSVHTVGPALEWLRIY